MDVHVCVPSHCQFIAMFSLVSKQRPYCNIISVSHLVTSLTVTIVSRCYQLVNNFFQSKKTIFSHIILSTTLAIVNINIDATMNDDTISCATSAVYISFSVLNFLLMHYILLSFYPISREKSYADHPTRDSTVCHTRNNRSANRSIDYYMNNIYNRN